MHNKFSSSFTDSAFTLLEVIISLVLISILMSVSINFLWTFDKNILDNVNEVINAKTEAKSLAIINGEQLDLIFYPQKIVIKNHEKTYKEIVLSHDSEIIEIINTMLLDGFYILSFNKMGIAEECLVKIKNKNNYKIVYLPTIGKPLTFDDNIKFEEIHKEYL